MWVGEGQTTRKRDPFSCFLKRMFLDIAIGFASVTLSLPFHSLLYGGPTIHRIDGPSECQQDIAFLDTCHFQPFSSLTTNPNVCFVCTNSFAAAWKLLNLPSSSAADPHQTFTGAPSFHETQMLNTSRRLSPLPNSTFHPSSTGYIFFILQAHDFHRRLQKFTDPSICQISSVPGISNHSRTSMVRTIIDPRPEVQPDRTSILHSHHDRRHPQSLSESPIISLSRSHI